MMQGEKKKICLIIPGKLPVPNIKGGAIETLITLLINQNEIEEQVHFIVICAWSEGIEEISKKYKNTEFHFFRIRSVFLKKGINFINFVISKLTGSIDFFKTLMHYDIEKIIKNIDADAVVVEHGVYKHFEFLRKYFKRESIYLHLHGAGPLLGKNEINIYGNIITVSQFLKQYYTSKLTDTCKQFVCLNGINEKCFLKRLTSEERLLERKKLGFTCDDFVLIYCGRLIPEKGVLELVKAIKNTSNENVKLLVVGSSFFQGARKTRFVKELERIVNYHSDRIVFTGYIPNNNLFRYYQLADCQVICSKCQEAAGLVAVEGSISGLPLIVTDSGGLLEYCMSDSTKVIEKYDYKKYDSESEYLTKNIEKYVNESINITYNNNYNKKTFYSSSFYDRFVSIFKL